MHFASSNKNQHELDLFKDIGFCKQYSKCAHKLDSIYRNNSFKSFYNKMKNPIQIIQIGTKDKMYEHKERKYFDYDWFVNYLNKGNSYSSNNSPERESDFNKNNSYYYETVIQRVLENVRKLKRKRQLQLLEEPSIRKYTPNYNAIRKKIPVIDFSKGLSRRDPLLEKIKMQNKQNENALSIYNKQKKYRQLSLDDVRSPHDKLPPLSKQFRDNRVGTSGVEVSNKKTITQNDCLSKEKGMSKSVSHNKMPIANIPKKHIGSKLIKSMDFNGHKDKKLKYEDFKNDVPCIGLYQPKYEYITKNTPKILFDSKMNKPKGKRYLLQKLWNSYNISIDYQLVNI